MAALFGGRSKGKSSTEIKYTELPQHFSDDDELYDGGDDLLFVASASNSLQNGTTSHSGKRNGRYRQGEVIELGNLGGSPIKKARLHPAVEVREAIFARKCLFICSIFVVGVIVIVLAAGLPGWDMHKSIVSHDNSSWTKLYDEYGTESCVRLHDVDGDGLKDIIVGMGFARDLTSSLTDKDLVDYCKQKGEDFPCLGVAVALRGYDGKELWSTKTDSAVFLMDCEHFDVNLDGITDCIATGRQGTLVALDAKTGTNLWSAERKNLKRQWNIYQVSVLPDLNEDKVPEILVTHGGEPSYPPEVHDRKPGRLMIFSGKTGKNMGRYMDMPNRKETYMTSVIYTFDDGSQYVLFGSGGETVPGDFMAISVRDLYLHVMNTDKASPNIKGACCQWNHMKNNETGIIQLFSGETNGVMVPPVIVDVNKDGVKDILMTAFEGKMILFDGKTLEKLWTVTLKDCQTYSTPAPGYFDTDDKVDFMIAWNNGTWPNYKLSMMMIVSGADGAILWKTPSQEYNMVSPLSLETRHSHQDAFLYQLLGRTGNKVHDVNGAIHGIGAQRNLSKRAAGEELEDLPTQQDKSHLKHGRKNGPVYRTKLPNPRQDRDQHAPHHAKSVARGRTHADRKKKVRPTQLPSPKTTLSPEAEPEESSYRDQIEHLRCGMDLTALRSETFVMDRTTLTEPILIWKRGAETYNYTLEDSDRKLMLQFMNNHLEPGQTPYTELPPRAVKNAEGDFCTILQPSVLNTGAIGDVDGDGRLDYIALDGMSGLIKDREGSYIRMQSKTYISKVNLVKEVENFHTVKLEVGGELHHTGSSGKRFQFLGDDKQKWTEYLGKHGDAVYS